MLAHSEADQALQRARDDLERRIQEHYQDSSGGELRRILSRRQPPGGGQSRGGSGDNLGH